MLFQLVFDELLDIKEKRQLREFNVENLKERIFGNTCALTVVLDLIDEVNLTSRSKSRLVTTYKIFVNIRCKQKNKQLNIQIFNE